MAAGADILVDLDSPRCSGGMVNRAEDAAERPVLAFVVDRHRQRPEPVTLRGR